MPQGKNRRRHATEKESLAHEVATVGRDDLMEAMIAACAIVAHADGRVDVTERRRVSQLMRALPALSGFSSETVAEEFARHERTFAYEPFGARDDALDVIEALRPHVSEVRMLLSACQHVLEADGFHHPREYQALQDVSKALGADNFGSPFLRVTAKNVYRRQQC